MVNIVPACVNFCSDRFWTNMQISLSCPHIAHMECDVRRCLSFACSPLFLCSLLLHLSLSPSLRVFVVQARAHPHKYTHRHKVCLTPESGVSLVGAENPCLLLSRPCVPTAPHNRLLHVMSDEAVIL